MTQSTAKINHPDNNQYIIFTFILTIMALMVATGIGRFVFTPILPIMLEENIVELPEVIWLSSANYIGYFVGALSLFKNHRHLLFLIIGLLMVTIATFFSSIHHFEGLFVFRFLTGVGGAWALVSASAWAVPWLTQHKVSRVGYIYTGVGAGICISGTLCSLLILQKLSSTQLWYAIACMAGILSLVILILLQVVTKNASTPLLDKPKPTMQPHLADYPDVWRLALAYGLFGFGYIIPSTFLPKIAKDMISGDAFLLVWPVFGFASVCMVAFTQKFTHISDLKIWKTAQITVGLATLLPVLLTNIYSLIITALLVGGAFMVVIMSALKIASQIQRSYNVVALMTASFAFGQLAGPLPALFVTGNAIWSIILPLSCISCLIGVYLIWQKT